MAASVTVIGGGLAGLAVALGLERAGWKVALYEQASAFTSTGGGLTMAPSAIAGLDWLGLGAAFSRLAEPSFPPTILDWWTGDPLAAPQGAGSHLGAVRRILRSDLHAILFEAAQARAGLALHLGVRLEDIASDGDGAIARMSDGALVRGDLLLGADGIRSSARRFVAGEDQPRFTGHVAWRFLVPATAGLPLLRGRKVAITAGPSASLTCYTIAAGTLINCVAIVRADGWAQEGWTIAGDPAELAGHFADAHADARAMVALAPRQGLFKWALFDRDPIARWHRERVGLLGDAAHPVLPFLGLGAGLAIEDAVVMTRALASMPVDEALAAVSRLRSPRAALIQRLSRAQGEAFARIGEQRTTAPAPFFDPVIFDYDPATVMLS